MAVPTISRQRLAALDTNVLFHLAEQYAPAHNLIRRLVKLGFTPVITSTVITELGHFVDHGRTPAKKRSATVALTSLREWGIQPLILKPVGNGICDIVADVIANRGLLPEHERNDAYVIIEAGFAGVAMLLSWDNHLLEADNLQLNQVLGSFDLHPVQVTHPSLILDRLS